MKCLTTCSNNFEPDDDEFIAVDALKDVPGENLILLENAKLSNETTDSDNSSKSNVVIYDDEDLSLKMCSITYFSGYTAKKCFDKFHCATCNPIKPNEHLTDKMNF